MANPIAAGEVKLACRGLWKVFGPDSSGLLEAHGGEDRMELKRTLERTGHVAAAIDINFEIAQGEIFVIMGLSGSGKSTLVRCLSRLVEPTRGEVFLDGEDLLKASKSRLIELRRRAMGMVFQNFGLLPHLTVLDNVAFPLRVQGQPDARVCARAEEMIGLVGLAGKQHAYPHELSGGQQQRVGIARSLAVGPELWFLDEPFSALDPLIRRQMQDEFLRLQRMLRKTIVFITHDISEAFRLADRIAIMRDGEIIQVGRPSDIALNPVDAYVAEFTRDFSLTRVIKVADLMRDGEPPAAPSEHGRRAVTEDLTIDTLISEVAGGVTVFQVIDEEKSPIGHLRGSDVMGILERDAARRPSR